MKKKLQILVSCVNTPYICWTKWWFVLHSLCSTFFGEELPIGSSSLLR